MILKGRKKWQTRQGINAPWVNITLVSNTMKLREWGIRYMAAPHSPANHETQFKIHISQMTLWQVPTKKPLTRKQCTAMIIHSRKIITIITKLIACGYLPHYLILNREFKWLTNTAVPRFMQCNKSSFETEWD